MKTNSDISQIAKLISPGIVIITGHFGCGKTNLTINLSLTLASAGRNVTMVDMDIVNPYFRASDSASMLEQANVKVVAPIFAGTTLDTPSLGPGIDEAIIQSAQKNTIAIIDVGGDESGAIALGRYRKKIEASGYQMLYVVNQNRYMTTSVDEAIELLVEIENSSGLRATHIVGNTHLKNETSSRTILDAIPFTKAVADAAKLELLFITSPEDVYDEVKGLLEKTNTSTPIVFPVKTYVKTPWE